MYAIIKDGGKQYKVTEGESLMLESKDLAVGAAVTFDEVLMYADAEDIRIGTPMLTGITITGEVTDKLRGQKLKVTKFRRRKGSKSTRGHRQNYTRVTIKTIKAA